MENYRKIAKQLKELDLFEDVNSVAFSLTEKNPELLALNQEHIQTIMWLNTILSLKDNKKSDCGIIAYAIILGSRNIQNNIIEISNLLHIEAEKIYAQIRENPCLLTISNAHANRLYDYLQDIGFTSEQIKIVFFNMVLLDKKTLKNRCDIILNHWGVDDLIYLSQRAVFSDLPYYDPIEAINVAVNTLGASKAMEFFHFYPSFFVEYRAKQYRELPTDASLYERSIKALDDFKNKGQ